MGSQSRTLYAFIVLILIGLAGGFALVQNTGPAASPAPQEPGQIDPGHITLGTPDGMIAGIASVAENARGVTITVTSTKDSALIPGTHRLSIHAVGACDASGNEPYRAAGDIFDSGDLGNLTVKDDGTIDFEFTTRKVTLQPGHDNSLDNPDGSSIVISSDNGAREACGIIFRSQEPVTHYMPSTGSYWSTSPAATPVATPAE